MRVHPTLIPQTHVLASVNGVFNAIAVHGDVVGETLFYGRGAGQDPTASAVISDLAEAAIALESPRPSYGFTPHGLYGTCKPIDQIVSQYYLRISVEDQPGVLAQVAGILGELVIGISSVIQPEEHEADSVPLVLIIHDASNAQMNLAIERISAGMRQAAAADDSRGIFCAMKNLHDHGIIARYRQYLPVNEATPVVSLNEGSTPLIFSPRLSENVGRGCEVYIKYEGLNPTGSFKDRGMTMAISKAVENGAKAVICASTGNTSAAAGAYAARAGIDCIVLLPAGKIAMGKLVQAFMYGAKVVAIDGNFDDGARPRSRDRRDRAGVDRQLDQSFPAAGPKNRGI